MRRNIYMDISYPWLCAKKHTNAATLSKCRTSSALVRTSTSSTMSTTLANTQHLSLDVVIPSQHGRNVIVHDCNSVCVCQTDCILHSHRRHVLWDVWPECVVS